MIIGPVTGFTPRPYQEHCVLGGDPRRGIGIMPAFARYKRVLAVMATGLGKTETYLAVIRRYLESSKTPPEKRAMLIAHRDELVSQPIERAPRFGLRFAREQGPDTAIGKPERAIASTIQSLTANRVRAAATALGYRFEKKRKENDVQAELGVEPKREKGNRFTVWAPSGDELGRFDIEEFTKYFKAAHPGVPTCRMEEYDPNEIGLIVIDECFPAGTLVDGRPIEDLKIGDLVRSYNPDTQQIELRPVVRLFCKRAFQLVRLHLSDGTSIVCTASHPFAVSRNGIEYVIALHLTGCILLRGYDAENMCRVRDGLHPSELELAVCADLLEAVRPAQAGRTPEASGPTVSWLWGECGVERTGPRSSGQRARVLLNGVQDGGHPQIKFGDDGPHEPQVCLRAHAAAQPHGEGGAPQDHVSDPAGDGLETKSAGWQRQNHQTARAAGRGPRVAHGGRGNDRGESLGAQRHPELLQARRGSRGAEDRRGGGRILPCDSDWTGSGCAQDGLFAGPRVDRVEILEFGGPERLERVCPGGVVYNVEVERNHNYFADGILVHNCHHAAADDYMKLLEYFIHAFVLGMTATPERLDGIGMEEVFEAVAYCYPIEQARPDGWLVDALVTEHPIEGLDLSLLRKRAGDLPPEALGELMAEYSMPVAANIVRLAGDRPTIVFCATVAHAHSQAAALRRYTDERVEVADGGTDKDIRRDVVADFRAGAVRYLVNAMLWTEGFDAPNASCIALVRPTCSRSLLLQCLDMSTQVLTSRGWLSQPDVREDDILAAFVPLTSEILWRPLLSAVVRHLAPDEVMYGVESPTLSLRVTGGHRLLACRRRGRAHAWGEWEFSTAEELAAHKDMWRVPVSGVEAAPGLPLTDDEIRFIGWVLTDGTITRCAGKPSTIRICQAVGQPWVNEIDRVLISCGFKYRKFEFTPRDAFPNAQNQYAWTISHGKPRGTDKHLRGWGALEPYISKDFPSTLDALDRRQFGVLLSAMHLGDGCKQPKGVGWTQRSYHLCMGNNLLMTERLQSLCVRRGYKANITRASAQYLLHIKDTAFRALGGKAAQDRPRLVPVQTDPDELVWCVENDVGTIIIRRNGKVCIVGNCIGRGTRPEPGVVDRPELRHDIPGRLAAIASSNKPNLLVLDFTSQVKVVGLASPADVLAGRLTPEERLALAGIKLCGDRTIDELTREAIRLAAAAAAEAAALSDAVAEDAEVLDPWDPSIVMSMKLPRDDPREARCSPAQSAYLTRSGIENAEKLSASRAKTLAGALAVRAKRNLCTYKQQLALQKCGVPPSTTTRMYMDTAAKLIDQLVSNGWRRPKSWETQPKLGGRAPTEARP